MVLQDLWRPYTHIYVTISNYLIITRLNVLYCEIFKIFFISYTSHIMMYQNYIIDVYAKQIPVGLTFVCKTT